MKTIKCVICGTEYLNKRDAKYCQPCRLIKSRSFYSKSSREVYPDICSGTVGALAELIVSSDLMSKGFEVFRALSPSTSCDLVAMKNQKIYPVEVRSGRLTPHGISYTTTRIKAPLLAVFIHGTKEIVYIPSLDKI